MKTFDPSSLPDFAQRTEAARLYGIWYAAWEKELDAEEDESVSDATHAELAKATAAALRVLDDYVMSGELLTNDEDKVVCCAACGVPLMATDEMLDDNATGEVFLRAALGLPPRVLTAVVPEMTEAE